MNSSVFGELVFNVGWKTKLAIMLFGNVYNVVVKAAAYDEKDGITSQQEAAIAEYGDNSEERLKTAEKLLQDFANSNASKRFTPRTLLFKRDGSYALLLDDKEDEDEGIAVCLSPVAKVVAQSEYL